MTSQAQAAAWSLCLTLDLLSTSVLMNKIVPKPSSWPGWWYPGQPDLMGGIPAMAGGLELGDLWGLFQPKPFMIPLFYDP